MQITAPDWLDVSRETLERLEGYFALLTRWNQRINLVSRPSLAEGWNRHVLDSAQLYALVDEREGLWLDLGSGGGLPGLVIAVLTAEDRRFTVHMIESDERKAVFLRTVIATLGLERATVETARIEDATPQKAAVISARALAPLHRLLPLAARFATPETLSLFPKGRSAAAELTEARRDWHIEADSVPSRSDPDGTILLIRTFRARA